MPKTIKVLGEGNLLYDLDVPTALEILFYDLPDNYKNKTLVEAKEEYDQLVTEVGSFMYALEEISKGYMSDPIGFAKEFLKRPRPHRIHVSCTIKGD